jgi:hypothetical protein
MCNLIIKKILTIHKTYQQIRLPSNKRKKAKGSLIKTITKAAIRQIIPKQNILKIKPNLTTK